MNNPDFKFDDHPETYVITALANLVYLATEPPVLLAIAVPVCSLLGSALIAPFAREWFRFYFDRKRHQQGIPLRGKDD